MASCDPKQMWQQRQNAAANEEEEGSGVVGGWVLAGLGGNRGEKTFVGGLQDQSVSSTSHTFSYDPPASST